MDFFQKHCEDLFCIMKDKMILVAQSAVYFCCQDTPLQIFFAPVDHMHCFLRFYASEAKFTS